MYEYLDRSPQVGDIVEFINNTGYTQNNLGSLHYVTKVRVDGRLTDLVPQLKGISTPYPSRFKVVKTKPGSTAQAGDTIIRIAKGVHPIGATHTVYRNFGEGVSNDYVYYADSRSLPHTDVLVLCKAQPKEQPMHNPFKVGDRIRCISNPNSTRKIGDEFTVVNVHNDDVIYKDGFAAYYKYFELVSRAEPDTSIKVGSHWERSYSSERGDVGEVVQITKVADNYVYWGVIKSLRTGIFLERFHPRPDLDKPQLLHQKWKDLYDQGVELEWVHSLNNNCWSQLEPFCGTALSFNASYIKYRIKPSVQETVEQEELAPIGSKVSYLGQVLTVTGYAQDGTYQGIWENGSIGGASPKFYKQEKEIKMTIQQLLQSIFGADKPTTDYDRRPAILVVAYNRDGSQMGTAVASSLEDVKEKVADTPDLWGCKVLTYTLDQEVSVDVPVKATKAKVAKPAKE